MRKALFFGGIVLLVLGAVYGQDKYILTVNINTSTGAGQKVWSNQLERIMSSDKPEVFLFEAENGFLTVSLSLHKVDKEKLLLVAGSDFRLKEGEDGSLVSANLKSISLKKGEKAVYYPLGRNEEANEGGILFYLELTVDDRESENI